MRVLGIDIGSSSIKGAVLDLQNGTLNHVCQRPFPGPLAGLPAGYFEVEPRAIVQAASELLATLHVNAPECECLLVSGQMGGTILVDAKGAPLSNYISWRDQRTLVSGSDGMSCLQEIGQRWLPPTRVELGNELQPGSTSSLLFWLAACKQYPQEPYSFASVADFVLGQWCQVRPPMHPTQAIGLLDLQHNDWHRAAFDLLAQPGLRHLQFPELATLAEPMGFCSLHGRKVACHAAIGDQASALMGIGLGPDELSINISTGSQVSRRSSSFQPGNYQTRCYLEGYLNTITHLPAGRSLIVLVDLLTELANAEGIDLQDPWTAIAERAAEADGGGLQTSLTFFAGPLGSTGAIQGITTENLSVGNLFRAAFENMADNYYRCAQLLKLTTDRRQADDRRLVLSGGLSRKVPVLRQLIEARFESVARESTVEEETLLGLLEIAKSIYR